jgi:hypothetical protein
MACRQKVVCLFFNSVLFLSLIWRKMTALRFLRLKAYYSPLASSAFGSKS